MKKPIDNASFFTFFTTLDLICHKFYQDHTQFVFLLWNMLRDSIDINNFNCNPLVLEKFFKTSKNCDFWAQLKQKTFCSIKIIYIYSGWVVWCFLAEKGHFHPQQLCTSVSAGNGSNISHKTARHRKSFITQSKLRWYFDKIRSSGKLLISFCCFSKEIELNFGFGPCWPSFCPGRILKNNF